MSVVGFFFYALLGVGPALAGEIVLYGRTSCQDGYPTIFAAGTTTACALADQSITGPQVFGASTSRNLGPSCTFNLYTDKNCQALGAQITSSGPYKACQAITKGVMSYKIVCGDPVSATLSRPHPEVDSYSNTYFMPRVTHRNNPAGHTNFAAYNHFIGKHLTKKPTGNSNTVGTKLAAAFFGQVPAGANQYTTSITDGGTLYKLTLTARKDNNYTAEIAARTMGQAAFASLMADTADHLVQTPCDYLFYGLGNQDKSDQDMGSINITYVAP